MAGNAREEAAPILHKDHEVVLLNLPFMAAPASVRSRSVANERGWINRRVPKGIRKTTEQCDFAHKLHYVTTNFPLGGCAFLKERLDRRFGDY